MSESSLHGTEMHLQHLSHPLRYVTPKYLLKHAHPKAPPHQLQCALRELNPGTRHLCAASLVAIHTVAHEGALYPLFMGRIFFSGEDMLALSCMCVCVCVCVCVREGERERERERDLSAFDG
jgi:hypothetical protein